VAQRVDDHMYLRAFAPLGPVGRSLGSMRQWQPVLAPWQPDSEHSPSADRTPGGGLEEAFLSRGKQLSGEATKVLIIASHIGFADLSPGCLSAWQHGTC
jgi:hypothetical protein